MLLFASARGTPPRPGTGGRDSILLKHPWVARRHCLGGGFRAVKLYSQPWWMAALLAARMATGGPALTREEIVEFLYAGREDGGPLFAAKAVDSNLYWLRRALAPLGLCIELAGKCCGWRMVAAPMPPDCGEGKA